MITMWLRRIFMVFGFSLILYFIYFCFPIIVKKILRFFSLFKKKKLLKSMKTLKSNKFKEIFNNLFNIWDWKYWGKTLLSLLNLRFLLILILILVGSFFINQRFAKVKIINLKDLINVEINIPKDAEYFKITEYGVEFFRRKETNEKKDIKIKTENINNIPELRNQIKPVGFVFEPFFTSGIGGNLKGVRPESGIGADFIKYYAWRGGVWGTYSGQSDNFLDSFAGYAGIAYDMSKIFPKLHNSKIRVGVGTSAQKDVRGYIGFSFDF